MEFKKQGHSVYYAKYHIVISTKYRRKIFKGGMGEYLKETILDIQNHKPEIIVEEVNAAEDHMHVLVSIPPKYPVSYVVNLLKSNTGRKMREKFTFLDKVYWGSEGIWSIGYFVSTVGINEDTIRKYIEYQGWEDSGQAKLEL